MALDSFRKKDLTYEGSVKKIFSIESDARDASAELLFEFTDDYSVFDWGKMPNPIPQKGLVLGTLSSYFFEKLQDAKEWQRFFAAPQGASLLKNLEPRLRAHPELQTAWKKINDTGLRTHYRKAASRRGDLFDYQRGVPSPYIVVEKIYVQKPLKKAFFTDSYYVYSKSAPVKPFLIPLEVIFRFEVSPGSSFPQRYFETGWKAGHKFEVPFVETFTKLEEKDRPLPTSESFAISGLNETQFTELYWKTTLVAGILHFWFGEKGIQMIDGKLEWGLSSEGEVMLVDAIGPDEMRLEKKSLQLSKELLRDFYRKTEWYQQVQKAKVEAGQRGVANWKSLVAAPPPLPPALLTGISEMYQALANEMTGQSWLTPKSLDQVISELQQLLGGKGG